MDIASANDGSTTAPCALHDSQIELAIKIQIDALIDGEPALDWADPAANTARREKLISVARDTASAVTELLVHTTLSKARGVIAAATDEVVLTAAMSIERLHQALVAYRRDTRRWDGLEVARGAMVAEAGAGVAAVATELLRVLWSDLDERMQASCRRR